MKVCLVSREFPWRRPYGGVGVYTATMARGLSRIGVETTVLTQSPDDTAREVEEDGVRIMGIPMPMLPFLPKKLARFSLVTAGQWSYRAARVFKNRLANSCDLVEGPEMGGELLGILALRRRPPVVVRAHGGAVKEMLGKDTFQWFHYPLYLRERASLRRANQVTVITEPFRSWSESVFHLDLSGVPLIPNPIDTNLFSPSRQDIEALRPRIGFVGRLNSVKGFDKMPEIVEEVLDREPDTVFSFIGANVRMSGDIPESGREYLLSRLPGRYHGNVEFLGYLCREESIRIMQGFTAMVLPSRLEAFSLVCAEAGACGCPVVGARGTGMEGIIVHGETGYLEDVNRPADFSARLVDLLRNPRRSRKMGEKARRRVVECFDLEVVARRTQKVYQQVIDRFAQEKITGP